MGTSKILRTHQPRLRPDLSVRWRGGLILSIPVLCLFAAIFVISALSSQTSAAMERKEQSRQTLLDTHRLLRDLLNAETGVRGYVITRRPEFLEPYKEAITLLPESLNALSTRVQTNPAQRQQFQAIPTLAQQQMRLLEEVLKTSNLQGATTGGSPLLTEQLLKSKLNMDHLRQEIAKFAQQEERWQE
ncbi:MAG: histidine kinase, partial [Microcoleus sp. SIO2G3]|nr:histidine kinase [Microcoleus sp. SIO2G3]